MKDLLSTEVGDEKMLYDPAQEAVHVLSPTARLIHELAAAGQPIVAIEARLRERFAVPAGHDLRRDIEACLVELAAKGLLPDS
ncbi:MAG: PqqD family protein [Thermodesulfobacteriota bacterium]